METEVAPPADVEVANGTTTGSRSVKGSKMSAGDPIYVYLAADNEDVKEAFARKLEEKHEVMHHEIR